MADRIQLRRDTAANWTAYNPILLEGEPGIEIDTDQWKLGDGVHTWSQLAYRGGECVQQRGQSTTVAMSQKAVTDELNLIGVFDISAYNLTDGQPTKYADLTAALGTNGANVPTQYRVPGMTVRYVQSSDNKYVQYRLITTSFSADVTDWQGVDEEPTPTAGKNLYNIAGYIAADTGELASGGDTFLATDFIKIDKTVPVIVDNIGASAAAGIAFYDKDFNFIANSSQISQTSYKVEIADIPSGAEYIRSSALSSSITENTVILGASVAGLENEFAKTNIRTNQLEYNTAGSDVHIFGVNPVINYDEDNLTAVTPVTSYANTSIKDKKKGSSNFYKVDVYALSVGNSYYLSGRLAGYSTQAVIFEDITLNTPLYVLSAGNNSETGYTDIAFKITSDKTLYLGVTNDSSDTVRLSTINDIKNVDANNVNARDVTLKGISLLSILPQKEDTITPSSVITGYPQTAQRKVAGSLWQSNIYNVSNCQTVKISLSHYTSVYGIAFSTSATNTESFNENISSKEDWFVECNSTNMEIPVPIGAVYMAVAQDLSPAVVGKELVPIENNIFGPLRGKTCLFIGDSISTQNNFKWKGFLETYHRLNYVRDIANQLAPANGGITLMPYQTEPTSDEQKTIWYRCAENRMSIYTFDAVSIFGGTNDMLNPNMKVGDVTIASNGEFIDLDTILPYVDEASLFDNPSLYTDVWSTDLTFTQCLMGCVEMIHRDFPTATIILPTVMPCSDNYGGSKYTTIETSPVYGMRLSERLAIATMRVANYYKARKPERVGYVDVIGIPFYWGVRTAESYAAFTNWLPSVGTPDGVHPNVDCAKRMAGTFAEMLFI